MLTVRLSLMLMICAGNALAQGPAEPWRTVTTPHFRVHYPAPYEAWTMRAASRLEAEREAVARETGYLPAPATDVLVMNPYADANGLTYALLDTPRIVLFTEPPSPESQIGEYSNWIDLLTAHEVTHLVHLLRPSRNPAQRLLGHVVPLNPISLRAPRWVLEGYATVVEGRLTGSGRPGSAMRAAVLRKFAQSGRLPTYGQLNSDQSFLGMSMAYLMGSSFLEWLEERSGPESMRHLWARMTARQSRSFVQAFEGVFGERPDRLYGQFAAGLIAHAVAVRRNDPGQGELWQETQRNSGDPAVSSDGTRVVVVLRQRGKPARMVIWPAGEDSEADKKSAERIRRMLERDPEDVAPLFTRPLPRKLLQSFVARDGGDIESPRWMPDGRSILYSHRQPDRDGFLHHDLFLWNPFGGDSTAVTQLADVSEADPFPDSGGAVAVRSRFGFSQLVHVTLATGEVTPITEPSLERVYSHPRVSADGTRVAFALHQNGSWGLVVREMGTGAETALDAGARSNIATPEWSRSKPDELYAAVLARGFIDLYRFGPGLPPQAVTGTSGAALMPAPAPDGRLFFMSLERDGFVLRVLPSPAPQSPSPAAAPDSDVQVAPRTVAPLAAGPVSAPRSYGIGRQEWSWLAGGSYGVAGNTTEVGVRLGDVVGRLDTIAIAGVGSGPHGAAIASTWRGWPVVVSAHAFQVADADAPRRGVELRSSWSGTWPLQSMTLEAGGLAGSKSRGFLSGAVAARQYFGSVRTDQLLAVEGDRAAHSSHGRVELGGSLRAGGFHFSARYQRDATSSPADDFDRIAVGGSLTSLLPEGAVTSRVFDPALPARALTGSHYEGRRLEAGSGLLTAFWQEHHVDGNRLSLAGAELSLRSEAMPILKAAALNLTAGVARTLDAPHHTRAWVVLRWRP